VEVTAQPPPPTTPEPPVVQAVGRLQLDATPYAIVFLGSRRLGITPIDVELPAGPHTLTLRNPEQQIETTYRVTVAADQVVSRRVALD
jgi:serine/threonine-protein kinase